MWKKMVGKMKRKETTERNPLAVYNKKKKRITNIDSQERKTKKKDHLLSLPSVFHATGGGPRANDQIFLFSESTKIFTCKIIGLENWFFLSEAAGFHRLFRSLLFLS
jgi:hypothetical protein